MSAVQPIAPVPGQRSLTLLLDDLASARLEVGRLRHAPDERLRLVAARSALLSAMESYEAALTERGLPIPWKLRDDLRLHRSIGAPRATARDWR